MHAALFGRAEFSGESRVYGSGAGDAADALKGGADHQDGVVGLAAGLLAGMAGVVSAIVLYLQEDGGECLGQGGVQAVGPGGWG